MGAQCPIDGVPLAGREVWCKFGEPPAGQKGCHEKRRAEGPTMTVVFDNLRDWYLREFVQGFKRLSLGF